MFKQFYALVRGRSFEAGQAVVDRNALTILRQQMRDSADAVTAARRAVAVAIAQNAGETAHLKKIDERMADLEARTIAAIEKDETTLAREAAEAIAHLEAERNASQTAQQGFTAEIERLKRLVRRSEARLLELQRGERLAAAVERTQRLRGVTVENGTSGLRDAEETLARLRERQQQMDAADAALTDLGGDEDPTSISRKLAEAGCGAPLENSAQAVLERLTQRAAKPA